MSSCKGARKIYFILSAYIIQLIPHSYSVIDNEYCWIMVVWPKVLHEWSRYHTLWPSVLPSTSMPSLVLDESSKLVREPHTTSLSASEAASALQLLPWPQLQSWPQRPPVICKRTRPCGAPHRVSSGPRQWLVLHWSALSRYSYSRL